MNHKTKLYTAKLRSSNLRPTKQRLKISQYLFDRERTFHFTVEDLGKEFNSKNSNKISLATLYNTVHAFKRAGHLKEVFINRDRSYFDTNVSSHHHFFDEQNNEVIDIDSKLVKVNRILEPMAGSLLNFFKVNGIIIPAKAATTRRIVEGARAPSWPRLIAHKAKAKSVCSSWGRAFSLLHND